MAPVRTKAYGQKFRKEWQHNPDFKGWLRPMPGDDTMAFCVPCHRELNIGAAGITQLKAHAKSQKHLDKIREAGLTRRVAPIEQFMPVDSNKANKEIDLRLTALTAQHTAIRAIGPIGETISAAFTDSKTAAALRLHRTKASRILLNVLAPSFLSEIIADVGDAHYSLIIDESTDVSTEKLLCLVLRYVSRAKKRAVTVFYRLLLVSQATSEALTAQIIAQLAEDGLPLSHLLGIGTDGASVMVGRHNSVFTRLREQVPDLVLMRCVCHSLHLAASQAVTECLPSNLDFLVEQTYSWFSRSQQRKAHFKEIYQVINGERPKEILQRSKTRWLSLHQCVERILDAWDSLSTYFAEVAQSARNYNCTMLAAMYQDPVNRCYLLFVKGLLRDFCRINVLFQTENGNHYKLLSDLLAFYHKLLAQIVVPSQLETVTVRRLAEYDFHRHLRHTAAVDYGYDLSVAIASLSPDAANAIKERCKNCLIKAAEEVRSRLPSAAEAFDLLSQLSPSKVLSPHHAKLQPLLNRFPNVAPQFDDIQREYDSIRQRQD